MDETSVALEQAIQDYLEWMAVNAYAQSTQRDYKRRLSQFLSFIKAGRYRWDEIFTRHTLRGFKKIRGSTATPAVTGLSRYLYGQGKIAEPIQVRKSSPLLPDIYEDYLLYQKKCRQISAININRIRGVLCVFDGYCQRNGIQLRSLRIDHVDAFRDEFFKDFTGATCRLYRSYLRRFLSYLYHERQILTSDLAPMVIGRREYGQAKPPKFLRPAEVQQLFASLNPSSASGIRTYAIVHLAYTMGLRPIEISQIRLDDIGFSQQLLRLTMRKGDNPLELPIPEHTLKAVAAYIIGGRPKSKSQLLFVGHLPPHGPVAAARVSCDLSACLKIVNRTATGYWLRHTYAQNLLEAGASYYDIKEMLGHDHIESTKQYLSIHIEMMRKVLFDEIF